MGEVISVQSVELAVKRRYAKAARKRESELCCPTDYESKYLKVIPKEILAKDYGCGDPSKFLSIGETVLDLGSGAGKLCFIASQVVGPAGRVMGVDFNRPMIDLAKKYQQEVGDEIGWHNIEFKYGRIQDLKPIIPDDSIDVIISNCVLNLVKTEDKEMLFREMFRVLKRGGRAVISDIVSDEPVPANLQRDPELWSGCISGAFLEMDFLAAFEDAGFYGLQIEKWEERPWRIIEGLEFRSVTVTAYKGKEGPCWERNQAVIYKGPWKEVCDDDQHIYKRGVRTAVCDKTFKILSQSPYGGDFIFIPPKKNIPLSKAGSFDCARSNVRDPRETKGLGYRETKSQPSSCKSGNCC